MSREVRQQMTQLYVAMRDGYSAANVAAGVWQVRGGYQPPEYAREDEPVRDGEALFSDWAHLVKPRGDN